jgi:hypothetical protein
MVQQCNGSVERQRWGVYLSAAEVAVVETLSLGCFQRVPCRETRPILRLNLC